MLLEKRNNMISQLKVSKEVRKDKLDSIKLKVLRNKKLSTTVDKKQYKLNDINHLENKIDSKSISKEAINTYKDIAEKRLKNCRIKTNTE